jgi:hypothetical protein
MMLARIGLVLGLAQQLLKRELSMDLSDSNADIILLLALKYTPHAAGFKIRYG